MDFARATLPSTSSTTPGISPPRSELSAPRPARWLYVGTAVASLITVFTGFAPSFYLRPSARPALAPLVVAHGIVFTCWVLLFFAQTVLVAAGRTMLHRRLGLATAGLAALMVASGPPMAVAAARRAALPGDPLAFLLVLLVDVLTFAVFMGAAIHYRHRSETHKRLMLLAMIVMLPPAISRWPIAVGHPQAIPGVLLPFLAVALVHDLMARRRLHPVSLWGGLALLASGPLRFAVAETEAWHRVARWLIR